MWKNTRERGSSPSDTQRKSLFTFCNFWTLRKVLGEPQRLSVLSLSPSLQNGGSPWEVPTSPNSPLESSWSYSPHPYAASPSSQPLPWRLYRDFPLLSRSRRESLLTRKGPLWLSQVYETGAEYKVQSHGTRPQHCCCFRCWSFRSQMWWGGPGKVTKLPLPASSPQSKRASFTPLFRLFRSHTPQRMPIGPSHPNTIDCRIEFSQ